MPKEKWSPELTPDLSGKTALVTGANTGLGKETAAVLAAKGARVILAVRSPEKGQTAAQEILQKVPQGKLKVEKLDLARQDSVKALAEKMNKELPSLDLLINNAGVMMPPYGKTSEGFELQFGTNHLGHFTLTVLLLPLLKKAPEARIVTVSSMAHRMGNLDFDDLDWEKRPYKAGRAYGDSKIANLYFTYDLARRLQGSKVSALAAHPGYTATDLQRHNGFFRFLNPLVAQKSHMGALPTLRAALDPAAKNGEYYGPKGMGGWRGFPFRVQSNELSRDPSIAKKLWDISEELTGVRLT